MTTVAYRDGVMASDSRAYSGDRLPIGSKQKIRRLTDGSLLGISSSIPGFAEALWKWIEAGRVYEDAPKATKELKFDILLVTPSGEVYYANDDFHFSGPLSAEYFAIGSGSFYAMGAMHVGATAQAAAECACALDVWSSHPVYTLALKDPE